MEVSASSIVLEQALFTSLQSTDNEGYQIAACSSGIDDATSRELAAWGPSHDSLQPGLIEAVSINTHTLPDGRICFSLSRITDDEYSGRGRSVATWMLIADGSGFEMFGNHPLRLVDAASAAGWAVADEQADASCEPLSFAGRARSVNLEAVAQAVSVFGAETLAAIVERTTSVPCLGIAVSQNRRLLIDALFSLLPAAIRLQVSFTTGLMPSLRRPFRVHLLSPQAEVSRTFRRTFEGELIDLTQPNTHAHPRSAEGIELARLLKDQRWCEVRRRVMQTA